MNIIFAYLLTLPLVAALDLIWLGFVMRDFYQTRLGHLLSPSINWPVAVIFYLTFALGIFYLASYPAFEQQSLLRAIGMGALLGIFA
ncbi:DUF2177 family protein, partial [Patescibacteria group bacterium]|nr:DUF2177 family protein [Patescibacteria group bacterium]